MLKPTEPKKVLCIHDLSGVGRCSLAVILPVLSVMGVQPVALPTVVLSTHTGGFGTPARMDGAAYGMAALEHYHDLGLDFACIYTGYLGGEEQIASRISFNEIDILLYFRDTRSAGGFSENEANLLRLCDVHNVPFATNIATAEALILALDQGSLDWRELVNPRSKMNRNHLRTL